MRNCLYNKSALASRAGGFTLIEMIAVIIIVGIIAAAGATLLGRSFSHFAVSRDVTGIEAQARVALERISRELRQIRGRSNNNDLDISTANEITFRDTSNTLIRFYRDGGTNQLMRQENGGTAKPLADNVTVLTINYYTQNATTPATRPEVYYITVDMTVSNGGISNSFSNTVKVRNFGQ